MSGRFVVTGRAARACLAIAGLGLSFLAAAEEGPGMRAAPLLPKYRQECASCHIAYPPGALPASSWQRILGNLQHHYGTDASLTPPPSSNSISGSRPTRRIAQGQYPRRPRTGSPDRRGSPAPTTKCRLQCGAGLPSRAPRTALPAIPRRIKATSMNTMSASRAEAMKTDSITRRILVWDAPTRLFHWLLALSFLGAYLTAESEQWRLVHITLGYTMAALVGFRLVWGMVGTRYARVFQLRTVPRCRTPLFDQHPARAAGAPY